MTKNHVSYRISSIQTREKACASVDIKIVKPHW